MLSNGDEIMSLQFYELQDVSYLDVFSKTVKIIPNESIDIGQYQGLLLIRDANGFISSKLLHVTVLPAT